MIGRFKKKEPDGNEGAGETLTRGAARCLVLELQKDGTVADVRVVGGDDEGALWERMVGQGIARAGFKRKELKKLLHHLEMAFGTGDSQQFEFTLELSGRIRVYECCLTTLDDNRVLAVWRELTEQKNAERLLRRQRDLAAALGTAATLEEAVTLCVDSAIETTGMDAGGFYLLDEKTGSLELTYSRGLDSKFVEAVSSYGVDAPNTKLVMAGKSFYWNRLGDEIGGDKELGEMAGIKALAVLPVLHNGKVIGCLNVASHKLEKIGDGERSVLETIASQVGGVIARQKALDALRESAARYRSLQRNIPVAIFRATTRGEIVSVNPAMVKMFAYDSEEELLAVDVVDLYHDPNQRLQLLDFLHTQDVITGFEVGLKRKDGSLFWGSLNLKGIFDDTGNLIYQDGIILDITLRKEATENVLLAKQEWENTFNSIPDMIMILDELFTIRRVNKGLADKMGVTPESLVGKKCYHVVHDSNSPPGDCPHHKMVETLKEYTEVFHEEKLDKYFVVTVSPLYNTAGELVGGVHISRDITEQKKMEDEMMRAEKLESLGLLAGGIAHDFNNILSTVMINVEAVKLNRTIAGRERYKLDEIEKAISRAKRLTQQLLTFSRGGAPIKSSTSIVGLLKDTVGFTLSGSQVKCEFSVADDLWGAEIDEGQISHVVQNIIINAQQALPSGGVIRISAVNRVTAEGEIPSLKAGDYIEIDIKDQGVGIPAEVIDKIFDPFFSTKQKGTGLGLSTAYSIIKKHNGVITVESKPGKGTTFKIYIPSTGSKEEKLDSESLLDTPTKGKILLMDDEDTILEATSDLLQELGFVVVTAGDGGGAVRAFREAFEAGEPFDVVIMDLVIPGGMGGYDALQEIKKIDPNVKAVVSSGFSTDPIMANYRDYGFVGAVPKPYKISHLIGVLRGIIAPGKSS